MHVYLNGVLTGIGKFLKKASYKKIVSIRIQYPDSSVFSITTLPVVKMSTSFREMNTREVALYLSEIGIAEVIWAVFEG